MKRQYRFVYVLCGLYALGSLAANVRTSRAQEEDAPAQPPQAQGRGALVSIPLPIPGGNAELVKAKITRAVERLTDSAQPGGERPVLVLELKPAASTSGESTSFEAALTLALYLMEDISSVQTVAYLPQTVKGHGVLVAMACEQIVMAPDAEIGEAGITAARAERINPIMVDSYRHVAVQRGTIPEWLAVGMLDPSVEVLKVKLEDGTPQFVTGDELEQLKEEHEVAEEEAVIRRGTLGNFAGREASQLGFVKYLTDDRDDLAAAFGLPPSALVEGQATLGEWKPVWVEVDGPITPRKERQLANIVGEQRQRGVNWIGVRLNSDGGDIEACLAMAQTLARQDPSEIRTVAFVPVGAAGGAALVALACEQVVMTPEATLGGNFEPISEELLPQAEEIIRSSLAKQTQHPWSVLSAFIQPNMEVVPYRHKETGRVRYMSSIERDEQPDSESWQKSGEAITTPGEVLTLSSARAKDLGLVWQVVQNGQDINHIFGFQQDPPLVKPNWALELVEALAAPGFAILLLVIGGVGLYIELQTPGLGLGGFIASVAFLLFFWSKFLDNSAGWLEVLLFVSGLCFMLLEVFVLPGFGVFGFGGGLMIIASLILASQTFVLPHSRGEMAELRNSLMVVTASGLCTIAAALALRRFLPHAPLFGRLMLHPPEAEEKDELEYREVVADFSDLVGQVGRATTHLRPAGRAEIGGELIDVIAEGEPIERGTAVQVVFAKANRVLVRPVDAGEQA
jgi:membrane-bound ClpP family serine protease